MIGAGVAQRLAEHGRRVYLVDIAPAALERARERIFDGLRLGMLVGRVPRSARVEDIVERIDFGCELSVARAATFVIENVTEKRAVKRQLHAQLASELRDDAVIAINSSAIPIAEIASVHARPERVLGLHFMNPVAMKSVIEAIRGPQTNEETLAVARTLLAEIGMRCIVVGDGPGYVSNRISHLFMNEAIRVVEDGLAPAEDVDELFRAGFGHGMGPLATADLIGLDTVMHTLDVLFDSMEDRRFEPAPLLREMVAAGVLGRKSGRGFFEYA